MTAACLYAFSCVLLWWKKIVETGATDLVVHDLLLNFLGEKFTDNYVFRTTEAQIF